MPRSEKPSPSNALPMLTNTSARLTLRKPPRGWQVFDQIISKEIAMIKLGKVSEVTKNSKTQTPGEPVTNFPIV